MAETNGGQPMGTLESIYRLVERVGIAGAIAFYLLWQIPQIRDVISKNTDVTQQAVSTLSEVGKTLNEQTLELKLHRMASEHRTESEE